MDFCYLAKKLEKKTLVTLIYLYRIEIFYKLELKLFCGEYTYVGML